MSKIEKMYLSWNDYLSLIDTLVENIKRKEKKYNNVYGIPRGGLIPATIISHKLNIPLTSLKEITSDRTLIIDDIADSGNTLSRFSGFDTAVVIWNPIKSIIKPTYHSYINISERWIIFPYEIGCKDTVSMVQSP